MKAILFALFVGLLVAGCEESSTPSDPVDSPKAIDLDDKETRNRIIAEAIDDAILQTRIKDGEELQYAPDQEQPYSGWVKVYHESGQIHALAQCKDGKKNGIEVRWYENGNKQWQRNLKNGKVDGLKAEWYENGNKKSEETYKEGKKDRFESWYENGNKRATSTLKNEKMMTQTRWKPNGEKCPVTNVVDGNGVVVGYKDNGNEQYRFFYQDGKRVG